MELNSPYLEAIQTIAGSTPGEKYRELNRIARKIASGTKAHGDAATSHISTDIPDVPEPLQPRVRLEIFNELRHYEGIVEALKSDDCEIVDRALRIDWFFSGDNKNIINVDYFDANLFRQISLNTRIKIVKKLSTSLRATGETKLAENFYAYLAKKYGKIQAEPLFIACGETFIWDTVIESKISLSCRLVKNLFVRYPEMIVRYLTLTNPDDSSNLHWINLQRYNDFLPRLIKNHLKALIELIETNNQCFGIVLSNKATERFLKGNVDAVLDKPALYVSMMPLKVIAAKITKAQYKTMFAKIYPSKVKDFGWYVVKNYIEYYPEQERISLIADTYKEVYGLNLFDNHDAINEDIMRMLPVDERARQARIKLKKEPDWHANRWSLERTWRCYLPIDESIPSIKNEISKTSLAEDRATLLEQMFYTCQVNDDKDALLDVLRYFTTRHKNEKPDVIFESLDSFVKHTDLFALGKDHWTIINDMMRFLHVKDLLVQHSNVSKKILTASIHFHLSHDLSIDENIAFIIEINMRSWNMSWNILEKHPEYERFCIAKMMRTVPSLYPSDDKIWEKSLDVLQNIVLSLYRFNTRNTKANKIEKLSIIQYSWLYEAVKKLLDSKPTEMKWKIDSIKACLKEHEPEIYEKWIPTDPNAIGDVQTGDALKILKNEPLKILARWDDYLKNLKSYVTYNAKVQRFVKSCRWYQDIPIKFVSQCIKDVNNETDENSLFVLGILLEGSSFARLIEPLVPKESTIDTNHENSKSTYKIIYAIPRAMNLVNPPVPLSLVVAFCEGEYLDIGLMTLTNNCRRVGVDKIEIFAKNLADRRVSVKKHGIRMFGLVASIDDFRKFLSDLWNTEKHRSIRAVLFQKIYNTFMFEPSNESWALMKHCMRGLTIDDELGFDKLVIYIEVNDNYIADYIQILFETLERHVVDGSDPVKMAKYIGCVLLSLGTRESNLLNEDYSLKLLMKYFCNPSLKVDVHDAGMRYALNGYLRSSEKNFTERLMIFGKHYEDVLRNYWDVTDTKNITYCPVNFMTHKFINEIIFYSKFDDMGVKIMETVLKSFLAVLKPEQDFISYVLLTYGVAFNAIETGSILVDKIVKTLPNLVQALSSQFIGEFSTIAVRWIDRLCKYDDRDTVKYELISLLCQVGTLDACTMAAKLLFRSNDRQFDERRNKIIKFLKETGHSTVLSLVYQHVNTCDLTYVNAD